MGAFKEPHGGELKDLYLGPEAAAEARRASRGLKSWDLSERQLCDLELLLERRLLRRCDCLLGRARDQLGVLSRVRLASGVLWPMPITLDVTPAFADGVEVGETVGLRDREGVLVATMTVEDKFRPDKRDEAFAVFGTEDRLHPGVRYLLEDAGEVYLGGRLQGIEPPTHYDFRHLRDTPKELRAPLPEARLAARHSLPDPQPDAPGAPGAHPRAARRPTRTS